MRVQALTLKLPGKMWYLPTAPVREVFKSNRLGILRDKLLNLRVALKRPVLSSKAISKQTTLMLSLCQSKERAHPSIGEPKMKEQVVAWDQAGQQGSMRQKKELN